MDYRRLLVLLLVMGGGCAPLRGLSGDSPDGGPVKGPTGRCDAHTPCPSGQQCVTDHCVPDNGPCMTDNDCENDTYCACPPDIRGKACACLPWGSRPKGDHDDMCAGQGFSPGEFKPPVLKCQWPPAGAVPDYKNVISTPVVLDMDRDGLPEIVFAAGYPGIVHLVGISGKDCTVKFDVPTQISGCTHIAVGDLDGDGFPEIVALAPGVTVYDHTGKLLASIPTPSSGSCTLDAPPAIANVDAMGPPEIITGGQVSRYLPMPTPHIDVLWSKAAPAGTWGSITIAEDLDGDGKLEVITGNKVYDGTTGADKTKPIMLGLGGGYPAIGDFNMDGHPDIVLVSSQRGGQTVSIIDYFNNAFIMPPTAAANGWGGAPTVADFDGDGRPEFATASAVNYYVYKPDCLKMPRPPQCKGTDPGVLWQSQTQDSSSGSTGSSVFDFNGDGNAKVVYRDECWLRVYNGPDGRKLFAAPVSSGTDLEMPVIADTDMNGHADIVVSSDDVQGDNCQNGVSREELGMPHGPPTFGVKVYQDPMDRWLPSRGVWNQHSYHITNINDDGSIPISEMSNFKTYNNYRQNVQGSVSGTIPVGDATGAIVVVPDAGDCVTVQHLYAGICDRGTAPFGPGLAGTFYNGDPRKGGAVLICTARTSAALPVGKCQTVSCDWKNPPQNGKDIWFRANDDGLGGKVPECKNGNDLAHLQSGSCGITPG